MERGPEGRPAIRNVTDTFPAVPQVKRGCGPKMQTPPDPPGRGSLGADTESCPLLCPWGRDVIRVECFRPYRQIKSRIRLPSDSLLQGSWRVCSLGVQPEWLWGGAAGAWGEPCPLPSEPRASPLQSPLLSLQPWPPVPTPYLWVPGSSWSHH